MTNPYGEYATILAAVATDAETLADDMAAAIGLAPDASGATADAVNNGFATDAAAMRNIGEAAAEMARIAQEQGPADAAFASAPKPADIAEAEQKVKDAEASGADKKDIAAARNHVAQLATEREDALKVHAAASRRTSEAMSAVVIPEAPKTSTPIPVVAYDAGQGRGGAPGTGGPSSKTPGSTSSDSPSDSGGSSFAGGDTSSSSAPPLSDSDAGTSLSADGSGVPMSGQQLAGQPQQALPQQGGQPQMAPIAQTGAVPSAGAGRLTDPALAKATAARNKKNEGSPSQPAMAPMAFGGSNGAGTGGSVDRGSSTSGVTTRADTSGSVRTALSGATLPQGTGQAGGMIRGAGMGGGMMGGAGGAGGAGGSGAAKPRPEIFDAHRPDETERSESVKSGTLSRDTANDPRVVEERERGR